LSGLQDEVPPEDFSAIRQVIEADFGMRLEDKFAGFQVIPHASASLGQVHRAEVDGQSVMVKVQRPDIEQILATDLAALRTVGGWLRHYRPISRRANVPGLIEEFTRTFMKKSIISLKDATRKPSLPTSNSVPVCMSRLSSGHTPPAGCSRSKMWAPSRSPTSPLSPPPGSTGLKWLTDSSMFISSKSLRTASSTPTHTRETCLLLLAESGETSPDSQPKAGEWELIFVDFGMVGRVPANLRAGMREMVIAMGTRDTARMIKAFQLMDVLLPGADLELLEKAEAAAFEYIWGKSMRELQQFDPQELRQFVLQFRELLYDMPFQVPEDMILLGRCVGILSGLCTGLNPEFNVWKGMVPYAETLSTSRYINVNWMVVNWHASC
jgi:predicted unusual protein kinase regulating ubiquinone biosynthesis (AarF/ABC1/UbiB family)